MRRDERVEGPSARTALTIPRTRENDVSKPRELARVRRAVDARRRAEIEYRKALRDAKNAGHRLQDIADAAGMSKQATRYIIVGNPRSSS